MNVCGGGALRCNGRHGDRMIRRMVVHESGEVEGARRYVVSAVLKHKQEEERFNGNMDRKYICGRATDLLVSIHTFLGSSPLRQTAS